MESNANQNRRTLFADIDKLILKHMTRQRTRIAKRILKNKNKFGDVTLSDFKICYKLAIAIKTV